MINNIVSILQDNSFYLEGGRDQFSEPSGTWFGGTYSAENLGLHTSKAHQKLSNSVPEAVSALRATGAAMETFEHEMSSADANSEDVTRALLRRTQHAVDSMDDDRYTPPVTPNQGIRE
ncbi:hypothetical protein [Nocardioides sp. B-3]|uniref:hypothetical protein n=1 Tax=Nocardioides sp. B-3 TaxID=2895565 RepID=UPI0021527965|nr:hypothetical protein [Nocardioides sp. B-3]UUZ57912.1 hypothetical protein LP418_16300 [Nocardioides sp. B-3]